MYSAEDLTITYVFDFGFQNWELNVKFVRPSDEGVYECQVSTHPPSSIFLNLRIVGKEQILNVLHVHLINGV